MMRTILLAALACGSLWGQSKALLIRGGMVVDGTGAPAVRADVLVERGRISAVGSNLNPPAGAEVIDATGHTVIPGLFDLHTHLPYSAVSGLSGDWGKVLKAYLYCGVTSVVDFGTYPETFAPMRRLIADKVLPGPRIHYAARITTPGGHGAEGGRGDFFSLEVRNPREAEAATERWLAYKPDAIKVFTDGWRYGSEPDMTSMDLETLEAIVKKAHAAGVEVLTHTVTLERAKIAAKAGVDVIDHGTGDAFVDAEFEELMRHGDTTYASTLAVYEHKRGPYPELLRSILEPAALRILDRSPRTRSQPTPSRAKRWEHLIGNIGRLRAAGAKLGLGTDAGVTGAYHGWSTLRELELLVAGGLTPLEAITAGTSVSAKALNVEAERGTIAPGKLADLVMVKGSPHENIFDIERIDRVFLGGEEQDRAALSRSIADPAMTPMPAKPVPALVDDFESADGRTRAGTLVVNATDAGTDPSLMLFQRTLRAGGGHSLLVQARMSQKPAPAARIVIPLTPGGVEPADASGFRTIEFDARGEGEYRLLLTVRTVRSNRMPGAPFEAGAEWKTIQIPLQRFQPAVDAGQLQAIQFEIIRPAGAQAWLEIDNLRFR